MSWEDHEELKSMELRSDRYIVCYPEHYSKEQIKEAAENEYAQDSKSRDKLWQRLYKQPFPKENDMKDFDFGFTTDEVETSQTDKAQKMFDAITPLLDNLMKNPENEMIKWPNRQEKVGQFKNKLRSILTGETQRRPKMNWKNISCLKKDLIGI